MVRRSYCFIHKSETISHSRPPVLLPPTLRATRTAMAEARCLLGSSFAPLPALDPATPPENTPRDDATEEVAQVSCEVHELELTSGAVWVCGRGVWSLEGQVWTPRGHSKDPTVFLNPAEHFNSRALFDFTFFSKTWKWTCFAETWTEAPKRGTEELHCDFERMNRHALPHEKAPIPTLHY